MQEFLFTFQGKGIKTSVGLGFFIFLSPIKQYGERGGRIRGKPPQQNFFKLLGHKIIFWCIIGPF